MPCSSVQRDADYVGALKTFLEERYSMDVTAITPAKRGFYGETWRADTLDGRYFVKLDYSVHKAIYERSFPVVETLNRRGIDFISRIVKTARGELLAHYDGAVLGVFEWIDGENIETDETKIPEYAMLARIYALPGQWHDLPREDFSAASAEDVFARWEMLASMPRDAAAAQICAAFEHHRGELEHRARRLALFSERCKGDLSQFFITHGDAGGNLIRNGDQTYLVDWDAPMLAPPERDAWVMCPHGWARKAFANALRQAGVRCTLRPERLLYYCYHMFFFYLGEYLDAYSREGVADDIERYFEGWAVERVRYADTIPIREKGS